MERPSAEEYLKAIRNLYSHKSDMPFINDEFINQINIFRVILENSNEDLYMCCDSLDTIIFNNENFFSALKTFLSRGKKAYIIVNEKSISEDILKLYKGYVKNIEVYQSTDKVVDTLNGVFISDYNHDMTIVTGKSVAKKIVHIDNADDTKILACFYDSSESKKVRNLIKDFLPELERVDFLTSRLPRLAQTLEKFKHLKISVNDLIDIFEFSQGKEFTDLYLWVKVGHNIFSSGYQSISYGDSKECININLEESGIKDILGENSIDEIGKIINGNEDFIDLLETYMKSRNFELHTPFYVFSEFNDVEAICFKKLSKKHE